MSAASESVADRLLREALQGLTVERQRLSRTIETVATVLSVEGDERKPLAAAPARRHRRPMTKAERAAISRRMTRYWAQRRRKAS